MNKVRSIAVILFAVLLMGTGYATWTETAAINNTLQIGGIRVEFVQEQTNGNNNQLYNIYPNIDGNDLNNDRSDNQFAVSYEHGRTITSFFMNNIYPGTTIWYEAKMKNLGTVPAILENITVNFEPGASEVLKNSIKVRGQLQQWRKEEKILTYSLPLSGTTQFGEKSSVLNRSSSNDDGTGSRSGNGNANGDNLVTLGELQDYLNTLIKENKRILEPGDYFTFDIDEEYKAALLQEPDLVGMTLDESIPNCLWFTLPKDSGNETENQRSQFKIHFNFKQFNK